MIDAAALFAGEGAGPPVRVLGPVDLLNGWDFNTTPAAVWSMMVGAARLCWFRGILNAAASTSSTFFLLPPGYRPAQQVDFGVVRNAAGLDVGAIRITPEGVCSMPGGYSTANTSVFVEGLFWIPGA